MIKIKIITMSYIVIYVCILFTVVLNVDCFALPQNSAEEVEQLFDKVIENRNSITSCELEVTTYYTRGRSGTINNSSVAIKIIADGERLRAELHRVSAGYHADYKNIYCNACIPNSDTVIFYDDYNKNKGKNIGVGLISDNVPMFAFAKNSVFDVEKSFAPDFRYIACSLETTPKTLRPLLELFDRHEDKFRNTPGFVSWEPTNVTDEKYNDVMCKKVTMKRLGDQLFIWIAPEQGYSIRKIEKSIGENSDAIPRLKQKFLVEIDVQYDTKSEKWYPKSWNYHGESNGRITENNGKIQITSLNQPIAPSRFTIQDIGVIKVGTRVIWYGENLPEDKKYPQYWDGKLKKAGKQEQ